MNHIKIGILGFGHQALRHVDFIRNQYENIASIVAIGDILHHDLQSVCENQKKFGLSDIPVYTVVNQDDVAEILSVEQVLEHKVDLVVISTPHAKHYHQIKACLEANIHVLVDKPLALNSRQGQELVDIASAKNLLLVVSSQRRYEDAYRFGKQRLDNNELGQILAIDSIISHSHDWQHGWRQAFNLAGGGVLWSVGWHVIDTICYYIDAPVKSVCGQLIFTTNTHIESHAVALILFERDICVTLNINHGAPTNSVYERMQLWGKEGILTFDRLKPIFNTDQPDVIYQRLDGTIIKPDNLESIPKRWAPLKALLDSLSGKTSSVGAILTQGKDSLRTLQIIEMLYQSNGSVVEALSISRS